MSSIENRILVTGGAGAVGSNLVNELSKDPHCHVTVLDNLSSGHVENIKPGPNVRFIQGGVESDEDLRLAFAEPVHVVYHLAANFANQNSVDFPQRDLQVNGMGTLKTLLFSVEHQVKRFVYSSSSCVYGNRNEALDEKCREFSLDTPYAVTKLLGEQYVRFFHDHHHLDTVILRFFNVYGPNEHPGKYRNVIANFFYKAIRSQDLVITGTGNETRDFNFVSDTVAAVKLAGEKSEAVGATLNIASGRETSINEIVERILKITGSKSKVVRMPRRSWDTVTRRLAAVESAKEVLGYQAKTDLETGLKKYFDWLKNANLNNYEF